MTSQPHETDHRDGDLRRFGRLTAQISHDLKNVLAAVGQNAGLLEDICLLAARGNPLDPEKVADVCARISAQVKRGDVIARGLNRFAHTTDQDTGRTYLADAVETALALTTRSAANAGVEVRADVESYEGHTNARPSSVHLLATLCLEAAVNAVPGGTLLVTCPAQTPRMVLQSTPPAPLFDLEDEDIRAAARACGATLETRDDNASVTISFSTETSFQA